MSIMMMMMRLAVWKVVRKTSNETIVKERNSFGQLNAMSTTKILPGVIILECKSCYPCTLKINCENNRAVCYLESNLSNHTDHQNSKTLLTPNHDPPIIRAQGLDTFVKYSSNMGCSLEVTRWPYERTSMLDGWSNKSESFHIGRHLYHNWHGFL